jgi:hypothetical protein
MDSYTEFRVQLSEIWRAVRCGLYTPIVGDELYESIRDKMVAVKQACQGDPELLPPGDQIELLILEAEIEYQDGKVREAANLLAPIWNDLGPELETAGIAPPPVDVFEPWKTDLFFAKISALLHYVYYLYHSVENRDSYAISLLTKIRRLIFEEVQFSMFLAYRERHLCSQ